jgi:hypothetical protein
MYNVLHTALCNLQATGSLGFEGFIVDLIGVLTGQTFFSARSGAQAGKDAGTAGYGSTYIDIECKRYSGNRSPATRDLLGGLTEAIHASRGGLEVWLLVSTGPIGVTQAEALRQVAEAQAVTVEILDWQHGALPRLAVLCASLPEETLSGLSSRGVAADAAEIQRELDAVRKHKNFTSDHLELQRRLGAADMGLGHARTTANVWLEKALASHAESMAEFKQALCPTDASFQGYVDRRSVGTALDAWYKGWQVDRRVAVVLGSEGNGKSWATMGWWAKLAVKPLTLLVTSNRMMSRDGLSLMASMLTSQTGTRDPGFWQRRLRQWRTRPVGNTPLLLLILDGLDERQGESWDEVLASLVSPEWAGRLATIITSRPTFWREKVAPFVPRQMEIAPVDVPPFDDVELQAAWGSSYPPLKDMPHAVRNFIRTPRILRLAREHVGHLIENGDLTVERLIIEDWCDRRRLKLGFAHSEGEVRELIVALAKDLREGVGEFSRAHLRNYSALAERSPQRDLDRDFAEIVEGRLFASVSGLSDRYRIRPEYAGLALGLLLARDVRDAYGQGGYADASSELAKALDPVADFDQSNAMVRGACAAAAAEREYPREARVMLFRAWLQQRSREEDEQYDFAAYLPEEPSIFFDLAELLWSDTEVNPHVRQWVADAILRWRNSPRVRDLIETRCRKWLGLWHRDWRNNVFATRMKELEEHRKEVDDRRAQLTSVESKLADTLLTKSEVVSAPALARLAILLISHGPRLPHVPGLVGWALSRAMMGMAWEIDEVAWCLRLNCDDPIEVETALLGRIDPLLADSSRVGVRASRTLLSAMGSPRAAKRLADLPEPPRFEMPRLHRWVDVDPLDPAASAPTSMEAALKRLADLPVDSLCRFLGQTSEDYELEQLDPVLSRFDPVELCAFYRRLLGTAPQREGLALRQLGWLVAKLMMVMSSQEIAALDTARRSLLASLGPGRDSGGRDFAEVCILAGVLSQQPSEDQLRLLLHRPEGALDALFLEEMFSAISDERANEYLVEMVGSGRDHEIRRLLWFLSCTGFVISDAGRQALVSLFPHQDPAMRGSAFRLASKCGDRLALRAHLESGWVASKAHRWESFFGSRALIDAMDNADYLALRDRVSVDLLGYLAVQDGTERGLRAFAEDLDAVWQTMRHTLRRRPNMAAEAVIAMPPGRATTPELEVPSISAISEPAIRTVRVFGRESRPAELDSIVAMFDVGSSSTDDARREEHLQLLIEEAQRAGREFFGRGVPRYAIADVAARYPEFTDKWIAALTQSDAESWDLAEFYCTLGDVLGPGDPNRAAEIIGLLRRAQVGLRVTYSPVKVDRLTWMAFSLPTSEKVSNLRETILSEAYSDELLFQIVLAAQGGSADDWLLQTILADLDSPSVYRMARGLTLIGFLDEGPVLRVTQVHLEGHSGFLAEVATSARLRLQRNRRARHWFETFLGSRDKLSAWAAFRLFLRCADRRFHVWVEARKATVSELPRLWRQHLALNHQDICNAAGSNENRLDKTLFAVKISRDEVAPWYRTPPTV